MISPELTGASEPRWWSLGRFVRLLLGIELVLLLALAQVLFAGYRMGVGNQSIQIPFLKHWADPTLYANDPMVKGTLDSYHSYFFKILAALIGGNDVDTAYFWLHVLTAAGVIAAAYALGKSMFKNRASAAVLVLLMLAGHHRALAGDDLYSPGFTHTWAVFPLAILALALFYKGWHWVAFALVGLIFNLHALTAAYMIVMFMAWAVIDYRPRGWWLRLGLMLVLFLVVSYPTLHAMVAQRQTFDQQWLEATKIRSADHSFPSSWWSAGSTDIPRFALLAGLAAVSLSFGAPGRTLRKSLWMAAGIAVLFLVGYVFTDRWPQATVVRAQLYRSSRLLVVLMLAHVAHGIVGAWGLAGISRLWRRGASDEPRPAWHGSSDAPVPPELAGVVRPAEPLGASPVAAVLEIILATATFACVAFPGMLAFAPWLLLAAALVATVNGRLSWPQAAAAGAALLVTLLAWVRIEYHVPGIGSEFTLEGVRQQLFEAGGALWAALCFAAAVFVLIRAPIGPRVKLCAATAAIYACTLFGLHAQWTQAERPFDAWMKAQMWAAKNTPTDAVFLTPPQQGGFRIYSGRSVVCEWRDGTQLYFSAAFAKDWWNRLTAIRPAHYDKDAHEFAVANALEKMGDGQIVELAKRYGANYVVLPVDKNRNRELNLKYRNDAWAVYEPRILDEQSRFIEEVALPNIEKYRKSDVRLELRDPQGGTITGGQYAVTQTKQAFGFGVSIPFFGDPAGEAGGSDFEPPPVTQAQLARVKGVFNYSVIPFSAKWQRLEPVEGERHYEELDRYVDWCVKNGIEMEFHYLSGFTPSWVRYKNNAEQKAAWLRHCRETVDRYHDRIKYWQVMNDARLETWAPDAFKMIRAKYPDLKLGISNCATFYSPYEGGGVNSSMMTGVEEIEALNAAGEKVDFFSTHGHKPMGVWPDMRTMYACLDEFAKYGVKVHISEATLDTGLRVISKVRNDEMWSPQLAAEFFEKFYTVAFSHPAMESINYWDLGPSLVRTMQRGGMSLAGTGQAGILDPETAEPRPLYNKLKELIRDRWMTRLKGNVNGDGAVAFRGFHGDYEVTVRTPDGKELKGRFTVKPDSKNQVQLKLADTTASVVKGD